MFIVLLRHAVKPGRRYCPNSPLAGRVEFGRCGASQQLHRPPRGVKLRTGDRWIQCQSAPQVVRDARWCGTLGKAKRESLHVYGDCGRKESCTPPQVAKSRGNSSLHLECVVLESLRVRARAAGSGTRTKGCTEPC